MDYQKFLLVKIDENILKIVNTLKESYSKKIFKYYNTTAKDRDILEEIDAIDKEYNVVFVVFENEDGEQIGKEIYLGKGSVNSEKNLNYKIEYHITSTLVIKNFLENLGLNLKEDFNTKSYLSIESSMNLYKQLEFSKKSLFKAKRVSYDKQKYEKIDYEQNYDELSQRNEYCKRYIGDYFNKDSHDHIIGQFQRDRERITHSKSLRRLVDKAQIFTSSKGDHFRTRMTHTLEVSRIARGISNKLKLNNELVEATALAHDIGHTPFGHQGERTLDDILKDRIKIINQCDILKIGGFKHSFQGLRVLTYLEEKYLEFDGLDLSYQILEGVLKHTNIKAGECEKCGKCINDRCFNIEEFLINGHKEKLFLEYSFPTTLEGQIVSIADEIAQRGHDLDDALASKHITIDELLMNCNIKKMEKIRIILEDIQQREEQLKNENRDFIDENDIKRSRIVSGIISYFIKDVTKSSMANIEEYKKNKLDFFKEHKRVDERLVYFSKEGEFILKYLEKLIRKKVVNSLDVSRFDTKSGKIIQKLFEAYYDNIMILPDSTLKRMYLNIRKFSENVIDFRNGNTDLVREEIEKICRADLTKLDKEYIAKRKIIARCIADYIASMTDNYAMSEYKKLFEAE